MIEAYAQGYSARQRAEPTSSCDHPTGSTHHREWLRGWTEAQVDERDCGEDVGADADPD